MPCSARVNIYLFGFTAEAVSQKHDYYYIIVTIYD